VMRVRFGLKTAGLCAVIISLWSLGACGGGTGGKHYPPPPPSSSAEYLFATGNSQVLTFGVTASTGALGTPQSVTGPNSSLSILTDPAGKFLYVSDSENDEVHVFSINATSGALTEISGSPYVIGSSSGGGAGLAMDPAGKFLFATDQFADDVAAFSVNSSTGALTAVMGSPFPTGSQPARAVVDATGKFLYVSDFNDPLGGISAFTIGSSGGLTPISGSSPFATLVNGGPGSLVTVGQFVYVGENNLNQVVALSINSSTGGLSTVAGSPYPTGSGPTSLALDPTGKYLYVANSQSSTISAFTVNATNGTLTEMGASPFTAGSAPLNLAMDTSGKFLYATNPTANTITGFTLDSTGALTPFTGQPFAAGTGTTSLTVVTIQQ
jgi:6-phosphogluconolactonase